MEYQSFFSDPNTTAKSIEKVLSPEPITPSKFIIAFDRFQIRGDKFGQYVDRYLLQTDNILHIYSDSYQEEYNGSIELDGCQNEYFRDENASSRNGIRFVKAHNSIEFFTKDPEVFGKWKAKISFYCIQTDFHSRFKVLKKQGEGKFASVYKVKCNDTDDKFAIKQFAKHEISSTKNKAILMNEIHLMKELGQQNHKNVLNLKQVHETKNSIYLVMDFLKGGELLEVIQKRGKFKLKDARTIMHQQLEGLEVISRKNICHRDLKPENLNFRFKADDFEDNDIVICDFGLATRKSSQVDSLQCKKCGTEGYIAPELLNQKSDASDFVVEPSGDMFSLGVIFYILQTGTTPWDKKNEQQAHQQNKEAKIDYNRTCLINVDLVAMDLLKKMLERYPSQRITVEDALNHKFFSNVYQVDDMELGKTFNVMRGKTLNRPVSPPKRDGTGTANNNSPLLRLKGNTDRNKQKNQALNVMPVEKPPRPSITVKTDKNQLNIKKQHKDLIKSPGSDNKKSNHKSSLRSANYDDDSSDSNEQNSKKIRFSNSRDSGDNNNINSPMKSPLMQRGEVLLKKNPTNKQLIKPEQVTFGGPPKTGNKTFRKMSPTQEQSINSKSHNQGEQFEEVTDSNQDGNMQQTNSQMMNNKFNKSMSPIKTMNKQFSSSMLRQVPVKPNQEQQQESPVKYGKKRTNKEFEWDITS